MTKSLAKPVAIAADQVHHGKIGDRIFYWLTLAMALSVVILIALIGWELFVNSRLTREKFGLHFFVSSEWNPVEEQYGAWPFIYGTLVSSSLGLLIAVPLSIATALYLTEIAPRWVAAPLGLTVELLAAVPSVILGLWGIFVMVPFLRDHPFKWLHSAFGFLPLFKGPVYGVSMLAGGIIVAIMIVPIITSIAREVFSTVPNSQREAAYALGATRWEVIRLAVMGHSRRGLFGAAILGLGRALGETMAITMVIGNRPEIATSLFAPGYTLASVIANEFAEATTDMYLHALFEVGLALLGVTIVVNATAQLLLKSMAGPLTRH
jgi:phosphate transport system permease protein